MSGKRGSGAEKKEEKKRGKEYGVKGDEEIWMRENKV
jgi:hypothetical protein